MNFLEVEITPLTSPEQFLELAKIAEKAGFDRLGVSDVIGYPDSFVLQALCLRATQKIKIGALVTNPYMRHPALIASSVATLNELAPQRVYLGIGVGASLEKIGIRQQKPAQVLREALFVIKRLLNGEELNAKNFFCFKRFKLERAFGKPEIVIGTRSAAIATLAGELADGVVLGARYNEKSYLLELMSYVEKGAQKSGRKSSEIFVLPRLTLCCSNNGELARKSVKPYVAHYYCLVGSKNPDYDIKIAKKLERLLKKVNEWYFSPSAIWPHEIFKLVDDSMVEKFAVAGTPEYCLEKVLQILEGTPFNGVSFNVAPVQRGDYFLGLKETLISMGTKTLILKQTLSAWQ